MGQAFGIANISASTFYPASTATLCVLPLRTNGQSRFSITPSPMPSQLVTRLAETEFQSVIASINAALQPLSGFGVLSLLLPFLLVDILTLVLLSAIDPWLILSPWDYPLADLLLPIGLEFGVIFCSFPLMAHAVNRRMVEVQRRVRELLDETSRRFGPRGVSWQLKQGVLYNGAGTNLWVEVQVVPLIHVQTPVPVPVPAVCPILLPSSAQPAPAAAAAAASADAPARQAAASQAAASQGAAPPAVPGESTRAAQTQGAMAAAQTAAAAGVNLSAQQVEYLRVLQENQVLRQYLHQCQALIQHMAAQQAQQARQARQAQQAQQPCSEGATAAATSSRV